MLIVAFLITLTWFRQPGLDNVDIDVDLDHGDLMRSFGGFIKQVGKGLHKPLIGSKPASDFINNDNYRVLF